eukprot:gene190-biopygen11576
MRGNSLEPQLYCTHWHCRLSAGVAPLRRCAQTAQKGTAARVSATPPRDIAEHVGEAGVPRRGERVDQRLVADHPLPAPAQEPQVELDVAQAHLELGAERGVGVPPVRDEGGEEARHVARVVRAEDLPLVERARRRRGGLLLLLREQRARAGVVRRPDPAHRQRAEEGGEGDREGGERGHRPRPSP